MNNITQRQGISLILFSFDEYSTHIKNVIDSFMDSLENILDHIYILSYDIMSVKNLKNYEKMITFIKLSDYSYNINSCVNNIISKKSTGLWLLWKPTFIFNKNKENDFRKIIYDIQTEKYDLAYIYGLNLYLDIYHTHISSMYSCRNGGCVISNNKLKLIDDASAHYYTVNKQNLQIQYYLYDADNTNYYFYNFANAMHNGMMLLDCFETEYINYVKLNQYKTFSDWYKTKYNNVTIYGKVYREKNLLMDHKNIIAHQKNIGDVLKSLDLYELSGKNRVKKLFGKYHDNKITIVTLVRNNKHYLKESMSSLIKQTSDDWNCVIINDGSQDKISYDDFIDMPNEIFKDRFTIINIDEWNGLVKCHKTALLHATNEVIGIMDVDDVLEATAIEDVLNIYNKTEEDNIFVYTNFNYCDINMNKISEGYAGEIKTCLLNDRCANHFRTFKLKYYYLTEGYDDDLQFGAEDQDILFKLEKVCTPVFLNKALYNYRTNNSNITTNNTSISSLKYLSKYSLFISLFKNIYDRYGNINFQLRIFSFENNILISDKSEKEKERYLSYRVKSNNLFKGLIINNDSFEIVDNNNKKYIPDNKIIHHCELYSNNIYIMNVCDMLFDLNNNLLMRYILKYNETNYNTFNINLCWDVMQSKFYIDDCISPINNNINIESFKKIHPNVYFDNIYIINLKKDKDKRENMDKIFNKLQIKHEFYDAVYGKDEMHMKIYTKNKYEKTLKSPGAYGYSLTMIKIFEDAINKKYKKILVCDDDIIFHKDFLNLFDKNIRNIPFDWKILFFGLSGPWTHPFVNIDFRNFNYKQTFIRDTFNCDGSYCVGYDNIILQKFINITNKFDYPFDTAIIKHINNDPTIIKYSFQPYLVIADTTKSDITEREKNIIDNFSAYQFKYRQNLGLFDINSTMKQPYKATNKNPYPLVSIIMTVFNKSKYLNNSIKSILNQTYKNIELIIIEDKSTDNNRCQRILKRYTDIHNIKIIYNVSNLGCYASRNIGIRHSSGEIIAFQDADDYAISTKIEKQINHMNKYNLLMVGCNMIRTHLSDINYKNDDEILFAVENSIDKSHENIKDCCTEYFGFPTLLIRKILFDMYGLYKERRKGMDMEFPERVMFNELNTIFEDSSWEFFDKGQNEIYKKMNELLVISPEMNELNITNSITTDVYLKNREWRLEYQKLQNSINY